MASVELPPVATFGFVETALGEARRAQQSWAAEPVSKRLNVVRRFRRLLARNGPSLARLSDRNHGEALGSEIIPLADAARFLELRAGRILAPQRLGTESRPVWLRSVDITVHRDPLGVVLLIGPFNYPLFLLGVQALQALVAGNAVLWKPGTGGKPVADAFAGLLQKSGLPGGVLHVLEEDAETATNVLDIGVDKVFLTGSVASGQAVLERCARTITAATVELSGCDALLVLPGADLARAVQALVFGLTFNRSNTCIAPRRMFVHESLESEFNDQLRNALRELPAVNISAHLALQVSELLEDAEALGGRTIFSSDRVAPGSMRPIVVTHATPDMRIMRSDIFAPVAALSVVRSADDAVRAANACSYALGASVFADADTANRVASQLRVGFVVINDLIAPTADPRLSFGGRGLSGFGRTRGKEGLLEMTVSKSVLTQRGKRLRHLESPRPNMDKLLAAFLHWSHTSGAARLAAAAQLGKAVLSKRKE